MIFLISFFIGISKSNYNITILQILIHFFDPRGGDPILYQNLLILSPTQNSPLPERDIGEGNARVNEIDSPRVNLDARPRFDVAFLY